MRVAAFLSIVALAGVALAADKVTARKAGTLRQDKNLTSPKVADVAKGQVLTVNKKEGKWLFAETDGKQGWTAESWLGLQGGGPSKGLGQAGAALSGSAQADATGDTAAVKGLEPLTANIANASGQDARPIQRLIDLRERVIDSGELAAFGKEGNVGLAKK